MNKHYLITTGVAILVIGSCMHASAADMKLWYDRPANNWESAALPIGNGRLGAMLFGGIQKERIQFNEESLWIGDENDTGAYQAFGDVVIQFGDVVAAKDLEFQVSSPSGQKGVEASCDGDVGTKWCFEHHGVFPIVWQAHMIAVQKKPLTGYMLTSADDVPARDPKAWRFLGSQDGKNWTLLDERKDVASWPSRNTAQAFHFENQTIYSYYRFEFLETHKVQHFQIAEITLGTLRLSDSPPTVQIAKDTNYRRELDINRGLHTVTYENGGVTYRREAFASFPAKVMVFRFTADNPGALTGVIALKDMHHGTISAAGNRLLSSGSLKGYVYKGGSSQKKDGDFYAMHLQYEAQLVVLNDGGALAVEDDRIAFKNANSITVLLDAGTDFVQDRSKGWRGELPHNAITARLDAAAKTPYEKLLADHIRDFQGLFGRVTLDLGPADAATAALPTDKRLANYKKDVSRDTVLESLVFQYGRYLMIASSRPGGLPANLQGKWNQSNLPPWRCDYHTDINVEMNYWMVDVANLGECFLPLAEWLHAVIPVRRDATKKAFGTRGWATRSENGIFGGATYHWVPGDAAWIAQNIWDHYAFSQDRHYLETRAYPILKELCEFWEDFLKEGPGGTLVSPKSQSPEHGPWAEGNSYEQQLVYDLFTNYIEASQALGIDETFRAKVEAMRKRLLGPKIGKWGQLQEWAQDLDDPKDQHRHTSHLIAVFPGRQITLNKTPDLAKAAAVSLAARGEVGDSRESWTWPWRCALWARLGEPENAWCMVRGLLTYNMHPNLFAKCPPFQIDGNFGITAGICEMLIQSHEGEINLLPSLPKAWTAGKVTGLRARGGLTVEMSWGNGQLTSAQIKADHDGKYVVRLPGKEPTTIELKTGEPWKFGR